MGDHRTQSGFRIHRLSCFVFLLLFLHGDATPQDYYKGDPLMVKVNNLASSKTQQPYPYYYMPYCHPSKIVESYRNLEEFLRGDHILSSPYEIQMRVAMQCKIVCRIKLDENTAKEFKEKIDDEYRVNMFLDNLPLLTKVKRIEYDSPITYQQGYYVGSKAQNASTDEEKYFINNHLSFIVKYHRDIQTASARVVGFEVEASSIEHKYDSAWGAKTRLTTCDPHAEHQFTSSYPPQEVDDEKEITFTYDVEFWESNVKWASRWDAYLHLDDNQIHWFSSVKSLIIVLFLLGMLAMIILRKCLKSCGQN